MMAFLEFVVKGLVDHPEAVRIEETDQNGSIAYGLRLNPEDVGKIIGRKGVTINAIRSLLQVGAAKNGIRCSLNIIEDEPRASAEQDSDPGADEDSAS